MKQDESSLFPALEAALKAASGPLTSAELYDMAAIKEHAASANRVSDYLGNLWRKGVVTRMAADKSDASRSRWAYEWKGQRGAKVYGTEYNPKVLLDRPTVLITEEGREITLEFQHLSITIRQKNK